MKQIFERVKVVAGDVGQDNLGLSPADRDLITQNANVIVHSAATLDFGDTLKTTVDINLLGTRRITELAKECNNLKVLVHVSSAYVNSWRLEADEVGCFASDSFPVLLTLFFLFFNRLSTRC